MAVAVDCGRESVSSEFSEGSKQSVPILNFNRNARYEQKELEVICTHLPRPCGPNPHLLKYL